MNPMTLEGKVALVTGASRGIGRGIALRLAERGAAVAVNDHPNAAAAEDPVKRISEQGGRLGGPIISPDQYPRAMKTNIKIEVRKPFRMALLLTRIAVCLVAGFTLQNLKADVIFFSGNLATAATYCGTGCVLGGGSPDTAYAQWAAVVVPFTVATSGPVSATTYSFAGGTSLTGTAVAAGGFEPYISLFDSAGGFLASTYFGTTCPSGANTLNGSCFDVQLNGGTLTPGSYYIALTAYLNMSLAENNGVGTLANGFTGLGNLGVNEDLHYGFDLALPVMTTPEPCTAFLLAFGLIIFGVRHKFEKTLSEDIHHEK